MAIGTRQIVLLTYLAMKWPKRVDQEETRKFVIENCTHPKRPVEREGKDELEQWRQCYCWHNMATSRISIFESLKKRDLIESKYKGQGKTWQLTAKGWKILNNTKRAPVKITAWDEHKFPEIMKIRISTKAEFRVLYN